METITRAEFNSTYKPTGNKKSAIFGSRPQLMEEIYNSGAPIWVDQSYYAHYDNLYRVERRANGHFTCDGYGQFEYWRDCHYYSEYKDAQGNTAWLMTGGRYD